MKLTFLTGPVRSGKSRRAIELATSWGEAVVFVATCDPTPQDREMQARIARHRSERPTSWRTLEAPEDVGQALAALNPPPSGVVLDCLTLWLASRFDRQDDATILGAWDDLLAHLRRAPWPAVIVGNEIGWGIVPADASTRRFRDLAGLLAQRTAAAADDAWLLVAGQAVRLK